jgi:protein-ribulosamine 3-kinase
MDFGLEQAGQIARELGLDEHALQLRPAPGGDIARCYLLQASDHWVFLKTLPIGQAGVLSAEADGLAAIADKAVVRIPRLYGRGSVGATAWLALEYLDLDRRNPQSDHKLGQALARLHQCRGEQFGWRRNNFIGLTPQANPKSDNWSEFFLWHRLGKQLERLDRHDPDGQWSGLLEPLVTRWQQRFGHHHPQPSLVHGDLWSGNAARLGSDTPVLYDPAVHYADRECDLAMARLFGGFDECFFRAYDEAWPLPEDHRDRIPWYQLYHLLNHANLFGGQWLTRARSLAHGQLLH